MAWTKPFALFTMRDAAALHRRYPFRPLSYTHRPNAVQRGLVVHRSNAAILQLVLLHLRVRGLGRMHGEFGFLAPPRRRGAQPARAPRTHLVDEDKRGWASRGEEAVHRLLVLPAKAREEGQRASHSPRNRLHPATHVNVFSITFSGSPNASASCGGKRKGLG